MTSRRRKYTRRALIGAGILTCGCVALSGGSYLLYRNATEPINTVGDVAFDTPLAVPPLLDPAPGGDGRKRYDLTLQAGESEILPGTMTATWGVNGPFLGPTIHAASTATRQSSPRSGRRPRGIYDGSEAATTRTHVGNRRRHRPGSTRRDAR